jgi:lysophospholipase L1-like esterase
VNAYGRSRKPAHWRIICALLVATAAVMTVAATVVHDSPAQDQLGALGAPTSDPIGSPSIVQTDSSATGRPVALFVGDSFTAGTNVENPFDGYPQIITRSAHFDLELDAQGGTGFLNDGRNTGNGDTARLIDRLPLDAKQFPRVDLLVVDAGRNDLQRPINEVAEAISKYLESAREQWPNAIMVLVVPSFISAGPWDGYPQLLAAIRGVLASADVSLVDPVADGWYNGVQPQTLLDYDRVHPNAVGNAFIAERLLGSLRQLGIVSSA